MNLLPGSIPAASGRPGGPTRRQILTGALSGAAMLGLAACSGGGAGSSGTPSTSGGGAVTLTHWDWWVAQEPWILQQIDLFQAASSGVTIERTLNQFDQYANLIALAQRSNTLPDVYMVPFTPDIPTQVAEGWLTPLNEYATQEWIQSFPAYSFVEGINVFEGKIYSAPVTAPGPGLQLYINNQVFKDAGLVESDGSVSIPQTWDDVASFASQINAKNNGSVTGLGLGNVEGTNLSAWLTHFIIGAGSPGGAGGMDRRTGRYTYGTDRNYTDLIEAFKDWYDKDLFHPDSLAVSDEVARVSFTEGKFGMIVSGVWSIGAWTGQQNFTDFSSTTLVSPSPERQGYFSVTPGGRLMGVSADSKHPQEAFDWFAWWASKDAGKSFTQEFGIDLSIHPENNDPDAIESAEFAQYAALADMVRYAPSPGIRNPDVAKVAPASVTPAIQDILVGVLTGQVGDIAGALTTLSEQSDAALDDAIAIAVDEGASVTRDDYAFPDWDITQDYAYDLPEYPEL